jgi:putative endonuclease
MPLSFFRRRSAGQILREFRTRPLKVHITFAMHLHAIRQMRERPFIAVYMMSNHHYGTLYIGVTADLIKRVDQHQRGSLGGFTKKYGLKRLVWYERHGVIVEAIQREKSLKKYRRDWKINLIEHENPYWEDLFPGVLRMLETAEL